MPKKVTVTQNGAVRTLTFVHSGGVYLPELLVDQHGGLWIKSPFAEQWKPIVAVPCELGNWGTPSEDR